MPNRGEWVGVGYQLETGKLQKIDFILTTVGIATLCLLSSAASPLL